MQHGVVLDGWMALVWMDTHRNRASFSSGSIQAWNNAVILAQRKLNRTQRKKKMIDRQGAPRTVRDPSKGDGENPSSFFACIQADTIATIIPSMPPS